MSAEEIQVEHIQDLPVPEQAELIADKFAQVLTTTKLLATLRNKRLTTAFGRIIPRVVASRHGSPRPKLLTMCQGMYQRQSSP